MGLAEDLKALQELREKGELTESAYAAARDAAVKKHAAPSGSFQLGHFIGRYLIPLVGVLLLVWLLVRVYYSNREMNRATAIHTPISLTDEIQNVPANSWKALTYNLPSGGTLAVSLEVIRGNPIDVLLTTTEQLETMNKGQWNNLRVFTDFSAVKTKAYKRTALLGPGSYYLVLRDTSLGIMSSSATDVSLKVVLTP